MSDTEQKPSRQLESPLQWVDSPWRSAAKEIG